MYTAQTVTLTEGMERYRATTDVNALALSRSETRPARMPPVEYAYVHTTYTHVCK